jgi:ABC-2 type transport system permease protein
MSVRHLAAAELTKARTLRAIPIVSGLAVLATWPLAWTNAASGAGIPSDDPRLFSSVPIPTEYQGFEMAGLGHVLIVALGALWAGGEHRAGRQIRSTLLATPRRASVFLVTSALLAAVTAVVAFLTMWGAVVITHASSGSGVDPGRLTPDIWAHLGGVTLAWVLTALMAFAIGSLARTAILPLVLLLPTAVGIGDLLAGAWAGARYLPVTAGAAMHSDPAAGAYLPPVVGGLVQAAWALVLLGAALVVFVRRDA